MRARNKKIVLIESINTYHTDKDSKFIQLKDEQMAMRIYRNETQDEGSLAEIFYEALLNESISKREPETPSQALKFVKSSIQVADSNQKRPNSGRIIRRSLSKNCSNSNSPQSHPKEIMKIDTPVTKMTSKIEVKTRISNSRISNKENTKMTPSTDKTMKSSRRSVSNKKQIKYTVKPHYRS